MFLATTYKCNWLLWVVCLNSLIHTLMYFYYALATVDYKSKYAQYLTRMQLTQFVAGIMFSSTTYFSESGKSPYGSNRLASRLETPTRNLCVAAGICGRKETRGSLAFIQASLNPWPHDTLYFLTLTLISNPSTDPQPALTVTQTIDCYPDVLPQSWAQTQTRPLSHPSLWL